MSGSGGNKPIDWARVEMDFTAGAESIRAIARRYGITEVSIRRRAKRHGWVRRYGDRLAAIRSQLSQATAQDAPRADPAEVAEKLASEIEKDCADLNLALMTARVILRRLHEVAETEPTPQGLRTIAEAVHRATETIFRVRRLDDQPAAQTVIIERSYGLTPTESNPPSDDF
jgi:transposase-like protein